MRLAFPTATIRAAEARLATQQPSLMASAAYAISARTADLLVDLHGRVYGSRVLLLVGGGDNGGDALYAGALLIQRGVNVSALVVGDRAHQEAMSTFLRAGGQTVALSSLPKSDLVLDGLVGMGGRGPLRADAAECVDALDLISSFTVAIDLPSGVDADTGEIAGTHIRADLTLATGALKTAHLIDPASSACGVVELIDLGLDLDAQEASVMSWQSQDIRDALETISRDPSVVDKYQRGVVGVVAGSEQYPGAAMLCVQGSINAGAGMVRYLGSSKIAQEIFSEIPEVVAAPGQVQALVVGPGLTDEDRDRSTKALADDAPALVDAGAIAWLDSGRRATVITPHAGELARHLGWNRTEVENRRLAAALQAADELGTTVLLKGSTTLIVANDGRVAANSTGSPFLATAGSGDVLAGVIGALMAQGLEPFEASVVGAWLHGVAGSLAGGAGASKIAAMLPTAFARVT
jgi:ADP-dependent NAD(P)H-hydrate dehydratase / NAD(P)H-hydrate epimerase